MLATSLKTVWARKLRLLMSTFAIVLGVAFVAGSLMFTDSLGKAFTGIMNGTVGDANVRLAQESGGHGSRLGARIIPPSALEKARATDGVKQVDGVVTSISATVLAKDGKVIGGQGAPAFGVNFHTAKAAEGAEGLHITEGRAPTNNGEIALDPKTAERGGYRIGDTVSILTTGETPRYSGKLVGFASYANGSMVGTTLAVVDTKTSQKLFLDGRDGYTSLWVEAEPGTSQDDVVKALKPTVPEGFEVVTGKQASDEAASGIQDALSFITTFLLVFAGVALLVTDSSIWVFVTGMVLMLFGTIAATPVLARPVVRGIGALARRQGVVARLAEENSLRNPRRTAATTSALMIGLALVSMMTVFGASASGSIDALIAKSFRGDFVVSGQRSEPMSQSIAPSMKKVDGVREVSRQRYGDGTANDAPATFLAVDAATLDDVAPITVTQGSNALDDSKLLVSTDVAKAFNWKPGTQVRITVDGSHTRAVNVAGVFDKEDNNRQDDYVVTIPTFEAIGGAEKDNMLHVLAADSADRKKVQAGLEGVVKDIPTITVKDQEGYAAEQRAPIDSMLTLIYGLLGLAIVIAVLGIINTLALSVIERTREIGLLRAVGLSRRQLRSMVRLEAVTISLIGALIGVVLGTIFGVLFQRTQADSGVDVLVIPYGRLALFLVLAALVGVLAAWWPARRASKLNILSAIATE